MEIMHQLKNFATKNLCYISSLKVSELTKSTKNTVHLAFFLEFLLCIKIYIHEYFWDIHKVSTEISKNILPRSLPNPDCLKPPNGAATLVFW